MEILHIKESKFNEFTLFFSLIDEKNKTYIFRYVGRHWQGNALHDGFLFEVKKEYIENWQILYDNVLKNEDFIKALFISYRYGFTFEKLWHKICLFFSQYMQVPFFLSSTHSLPAPTEYKNLCHVIAGKMEAYTS